MDTPLIDRRSFLAGATLATLATSSPRASALHAPKRQQSQARHIVIDGNLAAPLSSDAPLDPDVIAQIRTSGLTCFKLTLGGSLGTKAQVEEEIADLSKVFAAYPDLLTKIDSVRGIHNAAASGKTGVILSFEAASMLDGRLEAIDLFRGQGVLVMGLSYNVGSPFGSGPLSPNHTGLTALGKRAIERMQIGGVTVDLSHSDEPSSFAALEMAKRPVLITHAGAAAVYRHPRNKSDLLLKAVARQGGVIGIYDLSFLSAGPAQQSLDNYLAHMTHALNICGEDHVGIGSDTYATHFDTSPASMAAYRRQIDERRAQGVSSPGEERPPYVVGLNRSDRTQVIADALAARGYPARIIDKVLGTNFLRVFEATWG